MGRNSGKTALMLEMFKLSKNIENWIPCMDEKMAQRTYERFVGLGWCYPEMRSVSHKGQPLILSIDDAYGNPQTRMVPNDAKSWWVVLIKRAENGGKK